MRNLLFPCIVLVVLLGLFQRSLWGQIYIGTDQFSNIIVSDQPLPPSPEPALKEYMLHLRKELVKDAEEGWLVALGDKTTRESSSPPETPTVTDIPARIPLAGSAPVDVKKPVVVASTQADSGFSKFSTILKSFDGIDTLVSRIRMERSSLYVTVTNMFFSQPYQVRLQFAQNIKKVANISFRKTPPVIIVDQNDNEVGGVSLFSGAWVDE